MEEPHRQRAAAASPEIEVEHLGLELAGGSAQRRQQRRAVAGDEIGKLEAAGADLGQILIQPIGERRVEINDIAALIDGKEAGRCVIEVVDRVLQLLKDVLLPLALAGHVAERPHGEPARALAFADRPHAQPQPARGAAPDAGDAHLLLQALAFARGLEQPVDRLGRVCIADEHAFHRPKVVGVGRADEVEVRGIGVEHAAVPVRDQYGVEALINEPLDQRARGLRSRQAKDAGRQREQREDAEGRQHREEAEDVRLGIAASQHHDAGRGADQDAGDEQHENHAAAALRARGPVDRRPHSGGAYGNLGGARCPHPCPIVPRKPTLSSSPRRRPVEMWCPGRPPDARGFAACFTASAPRPRHGADA